MKIYALLALLGLSVNAAAQGTGLTNLMPPLQMPKPAASASAAQPAAHLPGVPTVANEKAALNGLTVHMAAAEVEPGKQVIHIKVVKNFTRKEWPQAMTAARAMQRDVRLACQKLCQPGKMDAPRITPEGELSFDLVLLGLNRTLTQADLVSAMQGQVLPKSLAAPALSAPKIVAPVTQEAATTAASSGAPQAPAPPAVAAALAPAASAPAGSKPAQ